MLETCLICEGQGKRGAEACGYCAGQGRLKVHSEAPQTVLMATGSCKVPVRKVQLIPPPPVHRTLTA